MYYKHTEILTEAVPEDVRLLRYERAGGQAHDWLALVTEAIAQAEALGGSRPTERAGGK